MSRWILHKAGVCCQGCVLGGMVAVDVVLNMPTFSLVCNCVRCLSIGEWGYRSKDIGVEEHKVPPGFSGFSGFEAFIHVLIDWSFQARPSELGRE